MLSFHRVFAFITLVVSFALLSHARPAHHVRGLQATSDGAAVLAKLRTFQTEINTCADDLNKVALTGENPQAQVKKIVTVFDAATAYLGTVTAKLTSDQEKECASIVSNILITATEASHKVGAKANFMKWYLLWTEQDVSMHAFLIKCSSFSFSMLQVAVKTAGTAICSELHDMKMRLMVNMFRGMGVGY